jgi:hypothetical protein
VPDLLQTNDLVALVPTRLVSQHETHLTVLKPPIDVPGFDVIAVRLPRVHEEVALAVRPLGRDCKAAAMMANLAYLVIAITIGEGTLEQRRVR